jgi:hypothetical protein
MSGGVTLGSEGDGKMQVHGYLAEGHFPYLKKSGRTFHVNGMDRGSPLPFAASLPHFSDHPLATNGWTLDNFPLFPNPFAGCHLTHETKIQQSKSQNSLPEHRQRENTPEWRSALQMCRSERRPGGCFALGPEKVRDGRDSYLVCGLSHGGPATSTNVTRCDSLRSLTVWTPFSLFRFREMNEPSPNVPLIGID